MRENKFNTTRLWDESWQNYFEVEKNKIEAEGI